MKTKVWMFAPQTRRTLPTRIIIKEARLGLVAQSPHSQHWLLRSPRPARPVRPVTPTRGSRGRSAMRSWWGSLWEDRSERKRAEWMNVSLSGRTQNLTNKSSSHDESICWLVLRCEPELLPPLSRCEVQPFKLLSRNVVWGHLDLLLPLSVPLLLRLPFLVFDQVEHHSVCVSEPDIILQLIWNVKIIEDKGGILARVTCE